MRTPIPICLLVFFSVMGLTGCAPATETISLRVMSFNIGYGQNGMENVAETIRDAKPDLVALQEVDVHWADRSNFMNQAAYLAENLGMELFFAPIYQFEDTLNQGRPREFGLAVLSTFPIVEGDNHRLPRLSTQTDPPELVNLTGFPEVMINVKGNPVFLFNTHLDFRPDPSVREAQVAEMLRIIGTSDRPVLLAGDFNALPQSPEIAPLFERLADSASSGDEALFTFPVSDPSRKIDYILHSAHFEVVSAQVISATSSDHLPLLTIYNLKIQH